MKCEMKKLFLFFFFVFIFVSSCFSRKSNQNIEILFSPQDNCAQRIISEIDKAKHSVYVAMYLFTSRPIAQSLVRAKERGIDIKVIIDETESPTYEKYSKRQYLINLLFPFALP